jgi:hypothetical protein
VDELEDAMVVPQAATVELQGNYLVMVVGEDDIVRPVPVKLGPTKGQMQVVMGPVKVGEKVVVGGVEKMRPGMKVNPEPYVPPSADKEAPGSEAKPEPATETPEKSPSPAPNPEVKTGAVVETVMPTARLSGNRWPEDLLN